MSDKPTISSAMIRALQDTIDYIERHPDTVDCLQVDGIPAPQISVELRPMSSSSVSGYMAQIHTSHDVQIVPF